MRNELITTGHASVDSGPGAMTVCDIPPLTFDTDDVLADLHIHNVTPN